MLNKKINDEKLKKKFTAYHSKCPIPFPKQKTKKHPNKFGMLFHMLLIAVYTFGYT